LYFSPNVIGVITTRSMRWMGRRREKPEEKRIPYKTTNVMH